CIFWLVVGVLVGLVVVAVVVGSSIESAIAKLRTDLRSEFEAALEDLRVEVTSELDGATDPVVEHELAELRERVHPRRPPVAPLVGVWAPRGSRSWASPVRRTPSWRSRAEPNAGRAYAAAN